MEPPAVRQNLNEFTYQLPNFKDDLISNMQQMYARAELCDLVLTDSNQHDEIDVHSAVIMARIPELKNIWCGGNKLMIKINAKLLRPLAHYCYYGEIRINNNSNLLDLYNFCVYYKHHALDQFLSESFNEIISTSKAVSLLRASTGKDEFQMLRNICKRKIINNILIACNYKDFGELSVADMTELFTSEHFVVTPQEKVLEIFLKWYYKKPEMTLNSSPVETVRKEPRVKDLLAAIRLPLIAYEFIKKFAEKIWIENGASDELLVELDARAEYESNRTLSRPQIGSRILKIGVNVEKRCISMEFMSMPDGKWISLPDIKCSTFRQNIVFAMPDEENIMMIGGRNDENQISRLVESINLRTLDIEEIEPLLKPRLGHAVAVWNGFVYVAGGFCMNNCTAHKAVERYDLNEKKWEFAPYLSKPRGDLKLIVFQNTLYALGGRSGAKSFNNVEYFDNTTESWITTTPMLRARCDFAAVVHNNRIYVVGGNEYKDYELKNNEIAFVECFDPNTKTWMHVASLDHPRDVLSAVVYENHLFTIGGWDSTQEHDKSVEMYDDANDFWVALDDLSAPVGNATAFVVSNILEN